MVSTMFDVLHQVRLAEQRIRPHLRETPLARAPLYDNAGARVWLKCENFQHTGSFKVRGALSKILSLSEDERARGVVAASTGNHGAAVAYALNAVGARGTIYVPRDVAPAKLSRIERLGAGVEKVAGDPLEAEKRARAAAAERGATYVSPYNDPQVVGGQGTVGVDLARQLERIDTVFVALGGGGLIAGTAAFLKSVQPGARFIGCSPVNSPVMVRSLEAGGILDIPSLPTLSDGTAGGLEPDTITLDPCRELIDECVTVTEEEIATALRGFVLAHAMRIEGAAAVAIAAYLKVRDRVEGNVTIVLCGGNIDSAALGRVVAGAS